MSWNLIDFRFPIPNLHLITCHSWRIKQQPVTGSACKRQAHWIQILLSDGFEGLDPLYEVGKIQIYSFHKLVSSMCQDTISGKLDTILAFIKLIAQ